MNTPNLLPIRLFAALFIALAAPICQAQHAAVDAAHTLGAESCRDCHKAIVASWERTKHATSFNTLANSEAAHQIAKFIGMKPDQIATNASCVRCHYTQEKLASAVQTTSAVSCESCHGGAEQWIDVHNSKSHARAERISQASALGMHHPASLATTAKACFECHVVDDEQLVNQAGHPALSDRFELLSWYAGEVKHNYLVSQSGKPLKSNGNEPQALGTDRKRMLFLTGKLLHLAQSLCALSLSTDAPVTKDGKLVRLANGKPTYAVQHALTIQRLTKEMRELQVKVNIPEYAKALSLVAAAPMSTGHKDELCQTAREIEQLAEQFSKANDGSKFAAVDSVIAGVMPHQGVVRDVAKR